MKPKITITQEFNTALQARFVVRIPGEGRKPFWLRSEASGFARIAARKHGFEIEDRTI